MERGGKDAHRRLLLKAVEFQLNELPTLNTGTYFTLLIQSDPPFPTMWPKKGFKAPSVSSVLLIKLHLLFLLLTQVPILPRPLSRHFNQPFLAT